MGIFHPPSCILHNLLKELLPNLDLRCILPPKFIPANNSNTIILAYICDDEPNIYEGKGFCAIIIFNLTLVHVNFTPD